VKAWLVAIGVALLALSPAKTSRESALAELHPKKLSKAG
jgi:hypothetical protein